MSNSPFSIRFTSEQRKWLREYATARDISEADALRELVDEQMAEKPHDLATIRTQIDQQDKAIVALTLALDNAGRMAKACSQAGHMVARKILENR
jgi:hypothetical protein